MQKDIKKNLFKMAGLFLVSELGDLHSVVERRMVSKLLLDLLFLLEVFYSMQTFRKNLNNTMLHLRS